MDIHEKKISQDKFRSTFYSSFLVAISHCDSIFLKELIKVIVDLK